MPDQNSNQNPCPTENEGNIVNVNCSDGEGRGDDCEAPPKTYIFHEQEAPEKYCCFDVYLTRFWITHSKDVDPKAKLMLMGYANEQSGVCPGLATTMSTHPKQGWVNVNQKIGSFKVAHSMPFPVLLRADALEWDQGLDGACDVGSDLEGDDKGREILLDCSSTKLIYDRLSIKIQRPRGGDAGRIALEFAAFRNACCC